MRNNRHWKPNLPEIHVAIIGANGSGKSALAVKYITKRYIGEYDPLLEDTYCKRDVINNREFLVWIMDTVESSNKDPDRYLAWADIYVILYSITNKTSFDYAEGLLKVIKNHEHSACRRQHQILLVGNKCDMERYRQVSKAQGAVMAEEYGGRFTEITCTEEYGLVKPVFHDAIERAQHPEQIAKSTSSSSETNPGGTGAKCLSFPVDLEDLTPATVPGPSSSQAPTRPRTGASPRPGSATGLGTPCASARKAFSGLIKSTPSAPETSSSPLSSGTTNRTDKSSSDTDEKSMSVRDDSRQSKSLTSSAYSAATLPVASFTRRLMTKSSSDKLVGSKTTDRTNSLPKKAQSGLKWFKRFQS